MINFPLNLAHAGEPVHETAAWFIPGTEPRTWLREMLEWKVALAELRLYLLPTSIADRRPSGVLVISPANSQIAPRLAIPYGLIAGKLYVPADARLDPPLHDSEVRAVCPWSAAVLHPGVGLVGFEPSELVTIASLFEPPSRRALDWGRAEAGIRLNARINSIVPIEPPALEIIFENGREDIGTEPAADLPTLPDEPGLTDKLTTSIRAGMAGFAEFVIRHTPRGPADTPMIRRLRSWLIRQQAQINDRLLRARHKELLRLINLLASDPDQGLRHAIPLDSQGGRGQAPPSDRLPDRDPIFRLGDLRGGLAGDAWNAPRDYFERLRTLYREAANRELSLGRHRRAAFIFAKLLGDPSSAATALRAGHHYREAAAIYRDFLKSQPMAAACLEEGGLLTEAIDLYREMGDLEKIGDLLTRLEQHAEAERAYREAVAQMQKTRRYLPAAAILEHKVKAPEEALEVLQAGWVAAPHATACLEGVFRLLGTLGHHQKAGQMIAGFVQAPPSDFALVALAKVLSGVAGNYPDGAIRHRAADTTRVVVGHHLLKAGIDDRGALLDAVRRLVPEDLLLARDTRRFVLERAPLRLAKGQDRRTVARVDGFQLITQAAWKVARTYGNSFFLAGAAADGASIMLLRGNWQGDQQVNAEPVACDVTGRLILDVSSLLDQPVLLAIAGDPPATRKAIGFTLPAVKGLSGAMRVLTPPWLPSAVLGMCYGEAGTVWSAWIQKEALIIANHRHTGQLNFTQDIDISRISDVATGRDAVPMLARRSTVYVALGPYLVAIRDKQTFLRSMPARITDLGKSDRHGDQPIIVCTTESVSVLANLGLTNETQEQVGSDWENPVATFTTDGVLVVADSHKRAAFQIRGSAPRYLRSFDGPTGVPVAIMAANRAGRFGIVTDQSHVQLYDL